MNDFEKSIADASQSGLYARDIKTIQVNVGLKCNQQCRHCHLQCGPERAEVMTWPVMEKILKIVDDHPCQLVDITGGSPELNP